MCLALVRRARRFLYALAGRTNAIDEASGQGIRVIVPVQQELANRCDERRFIRAYRRRHKALQVSKLQPNPEGLRAVPWIMNAAQA
jgi:hypothetical protein